MNRLPAACALAVLIGLASVIPALAQSTSGSPAPAHRVYDRAGVLSPQEIDRLESASMELSRHGALAMVVLQVRNAAPGDTDDDARQLMEAWHLESQPGAGDGVLLLLNLRPEDHHHGEAALHVGPRLLRGPLPERELHSILDERMRPVLAEGRLGDGLSAGLDSISQSLQGHPLATGGPAAVIRGPVNSLAIAMAVVVMGIALAARWRRRSGRPAPALKASPDNQPPAVMGAVTGGHVGPHLIDATILDLGSRKALRIVPDGRHVKAVRLIHSDRVHDGFERRLWEALEARAGADRLVPSHHLYLLRRNPALLDEIRSELRTRSWLAPPARKFAWVPDRLAGAGRVPAIAGALSGGAAAATLAATLVWAEPSGMMGASALALSAWIGLRMAWSIPETTPQGEAVAAPWREYLSGVKKSTAHGDPIDLDVAVVRLLAMNRLRLLRRQLKLADAAGRIPPWLATSDGDVIRFGYIDSYRWTGSGGGDGGGGGSGGGGGGFDGGGVSGGF